MADVIGATSITVQPDTTGFAAKVQAAVKNALRGVKTDIPAPNVDFSGVKAEADRAGAAVKDSFQNAKKGSDTALGGVGGAATFAPARISANRAADSVSDSFKRASRQSNAAMARIGDGNPFGQLVKQALAFITALGLMKGLLLALKLGGIFAPLIGGAVAAVAAIISVSGALAPLIGLLGVLPGAILGAATAFGVIALASKGVGEALKASSTSAAESAAQAKANAAAQKAAASALESAQERVRNAVERVLRSEENLVRAQKNAKAAQEDLTRARKAAREELEDLRLAVMGAQLSEERARISLQQAIRAEAELRRKAAQDGTIDALQLADAALSVREAELNLEQAIESRGDTTERATELNAKGVEGSDQVVAAQERLADANQAVIDSTKDIAESNRDLAKALAAVTLAAEEFGAAGKDNANKFRDAMNELSPAAQSFVNTLLSFKAPMKELSALAAAGLFPGVEAGLRALFPLFETLRPVIFANAQAMGFFAQRLGELIGSPAFSGDLVTVGMANSRVIRTLTDAFIKILPVFTDIAVAAIPLVQGLADMARAWAANTAATSSAARESGRMQVFFEKTLDVTKKVIAIIANLGKALADLFGGANEGLPLLDTLVRLTAQFRAFMDRARESGAIAKVFETIGKVTRVVFETIAAVASVALRILSAFGPAVGPLVEIFKQMVSPLTSNKELVDGLIDLIGTLNPIIVELAAVFRDLAPLVSSLAVALAPLIVLLAGAFVEVLGVIVRELLPPFVQFLTDVLIPALIKLEPLFVPIISAFIALKVGLAVAGAITAAVTAFQAMAAVLAVLASPLVLIPLAIAAVGLALYLAYQRFEPFRNIVDEVGRFLRDVFGAALEFIKDLIPKVVSGFTKFLDVVKAVGGWIDKNFTPIIKELGLLFEALIPIFKIVFGILQTLFENTFMALRGVFEIFVNIVTTLWRNFGDNIIRFLEIAFNHIKKVIEAVLKVVLGIIQVFTGILTGDWGKAWNGIKNVVTGVFDFILAFIKTAWDLLILSFQTAFDIVLSIFQIFWDTIKTVVTTGWDIIKNIFRGAIDAIIGVFRFLYDIVVGNSIIPDLINAIFDWFLNLPGKIFNLVRDFVNKAIDMFLSLKNKVFELVGNLIGDVIGGITSLPGKIIEMIPRMIDAGKRFIGGLIDGIRDMLGRVGDIGKAVANAIIGFINRNIIDNVNGALEFEIFGRKVDAPDISHIPFLARGQIVDKATVAVIGEAGKEVVLPLTDAKRTLELAHQSGLFEVLAKATAGQPQSAASIPSAIGASGGSGSGGVVFGPGSVVVQFSGSVTPEEARVVGQQVGRGIEDVMEAQEAEVEARAY